MKRAKVWNLTVEMITTVWSTRTNPTTLKIPGENYYKQSQADDDRKAKEQVNEDVLRA